MSTKFNVRLKSEETFFFLHIILFRFVFNFFERDGVQRGPEIGPNYWFAIFSV